MSSKGAPDLKKQPLFRSLPPAERNYLKSCLRKREIPSGTVLLLNGIRGNFFAVLATGQVEIIASTGQEMVLKAGDSFGDAMLRYGVPSSYTVKTTAPTTLWILSRADWLVLNERPRALKAIQISNKTRRLRIGLFSATLVMILLLMFLGPPSLILINQTLASAALNASQPTLAEQYLQFALLWKPDSAILNDAMGYVLYNQGKINEATRFFQKAVELDDSLASAQNNLGVAMLAMGNSSQAVSHFLAASSLNPGNANTHNNLGNAYYIEGSYDAAEIAYQRAIELDQSQVVAKAKLGEILLEQGNSAHARQIWEELIQDEVEQGTAHTGLGVISILEGRPQDALPHLESARNENPNNAIVHLYLGLAYEALNKPAEAVLEFEQAIQLSDEQNLLILAQAHIQNIYQQILPGGTVMKGGEEKNYP